MHTDDENELTAEERMLLSALPREIAPGDLLEERVVRALRKEGHLGGIRARGIRGLSVALRIAAALALFAGGVVTGRYLMMPDAPQSASVASPSSVRAQDTTPASNGSIPVRGNVTVVAEREMWL